MIKNYLLLDSILMLWYKSFIDLCDPNPCQNGGTCDTGVCECTGDYAGKLCEIGNVWYLIQTYFFDSQKILITLL